MAYRSIRVNPKALVAVAQNQTKSMKRNINSAATGYECWADCCGCCGCNGGCVWNPVDPYSPPDTMPAMNLDQATRSRWVISNHPNFNGSAIIYDGDECFQFPCMCIYPSSDPIEGETMRATECQDCGTCERSTTEVDEYGWPVIEVNCTGDCHCRGYTQFPLGTAFDWDFRCINTPSCGCTWEYIYNDGSGWDEYGPSANSLSMIVPCMKGNNCNDCPVPDLQEGCSGSCTYTWVPPQQSGVDIFGNPIFLPGYHIPTNNCNSGCGCNKCYQIGHADIDPNCIPPVTTSYPCEVVLTPRDNFHTVPGTRFYRTCT